MMQRVARSRVKNRLCGAFLFHDDFKVFEFGFAAKQQVDAEWKEKQESGGHIRGPNWDSCLRGKQDFTGADHSAGQDE